MHLYWANHFIVYKDVWKAVFLFKICNRVGEIKNCQMARKVMNLNVLKRRKLSLNQAHCQRDCPCCNAWWWARGLMLGKHL